MKLEFNPEIVSTELINFNTADIGEGRILTVVCEKMVLESHGKQKSILSFGHSVKSSTDEKNERLGQLIAAGRAEKTPAMMVMVQGQPTTKMIEKFATILEKDFKKRFSNYVKTGKGRPVATV